MWVWTRLFAGISTSPVARLKFWVPKERMQEFRETRDTSLSALHNPRAPAGARLCRSSGLSRLRLSVSESAANVAEQLYKESIKNSNRTSHTRKGCSQPRDLTRSDATIKSAHADDDKTGGASRRPSGPSLAEGAPASTAASKKEKSPAPVARAPFRGYSQLQSKQSMKSSDWDGLPRLNSRR